MMRLVKMHANMPPPQWPPKPHNNLNDDGYAHFRSAAAAVANRCIWLAVMASGWTSGFGHGRGTGIDAGEGTVGSGTGADTGEVRGRSAPRAPMPRLASGSRRTQA